jgi:hypothetical protein
MYVVTLLLTLPGGGEPVGVSVPNNIDQPSLSKRIDELLLKSPAPSRKPAAIADDSEFLRRLYLDLVGTIPPASVAREFLADRSPTKRTELVDRLLTTPEHARHLAHVFDVALMDRRPESKVPTAAWREFLRTSFAENKPWDQITREILSADGVDPKKRPAARFFLDRDFEPNLVVRDISRLFLGKDLKCAQCHDHPNVFDYKQDHYYGLMAFVNRTTMFPNANDKAAMLAELAEGEVSFQSVFDKNKTIRSTKPILPGLKALEEPKFEKGNEYEVAPAKGVRAVPKFSRRSQLAAVMTSTENKTFARAAANRFWALLMGRGIVHPLDMDHSGNPPSHPELLDLLTVEFASHHFDIRWYLREIALSEAYQRSSIDPSGKMADEAPFSVGHLKPLTPEQLAFGLMQASGFTDAERVALAKNLNESALYAKLFPNVTPFVTAFGTKSGEPEEHRFHATLEQTLFLKNGPVLRAWLTPRVGNLMDRLGKLKAPNEMLDELFLSILTRKPTEVERKELGLFLQGPAKDRPALLAELAWALMTSTEFRFNH